MEAIREEKMSDTMQNVKKHKTDARELETLAEQNEERALWKKGKINSIHLHIQ